MRIDIFYLLHTVLWNLYLATVDPVCVQICAAEPCNSVSTGLQCEMDPVSQTQACDVLSSLGFSVVGWYHSHPSFHPNPSVRDINTQDQFQVKMSGPPSHTAVGLRERVIWFFSSWLFQSYFSRGGAPFIGMIVSPYDPANCSPHSQTTCLLVKESQEPSGSESMLTPHTHTIQNVKTVEIKRLWNQADNVGQ